MQHHFASEGTNFTAPFAEKWPFSSACQTPHKSDGAEATKVAEEHLVWSRAWERYVRHQTVTHKGKEIYGTHSHPGKRVNERANKTNKNIYLIKKLFGHKWTPGWQHQARQFPDMFFPEGQAALWLIKFEKHAYKVYSCLCSLLAERIYVHELVFQIAVAKDNSKDLPDKNILCCMAVPKQWFW